MIQSDLEEEGFTWRRPPSEEYELPDAMLNLPIKALEQTLDVFRATAIQRVEACCFWYGVRSKAGSAIVLGVVVPKQRNTWGNYFVSAAAVADMAAATRPRGWVNLAQVHSHPGRSVEHSSYDDDHANSRRALSIVFPHYGQWQGPWSAGVGVHEFQHDYWHLLSDPNAARRVAVVNVGDTELLDLR